MSLGSKFWMTMALLLAPTWLESQTNPMDLPSHLRHPRIQAVLVEIRDLNKKIEREEEALRTGDIRYLPGKDPLHAKSRAAIAGYRKRQDALRQEAIKEAISAFGLFPDRWSGELHDDTPFRQMRADFKVVFRRESEGRTLRDKAGKTHYLDPKADQIKRKEKGNLTGVAWPDGLITVSEHAFESPGYLAATIWHEMAHWDQMTAEDGRLRYDRRDRSIREMHAIQRTMGAQHARDFGLTPAEERNIKAYYDRILKHPPQEYFHSVLMSGESLVAPAESGDGVRFPKDSLADIMQKAARIEANVERRNREERAVKEALEGVDSSPPDEDRPSPAELYDERSDPRRTQGRSPALLPPSGQRGLNRGLLALAQAACASRDGVSPEAAMRLKADRRRYPAQPGGSPCLRAVYAALLDWNSSVESGTVLDAGWVNARAAPFFAAPEAAAQPSPYNPPSPPPFKEPPRMGQPGSGPARRQLDGIRRGSGSFN